MENNKLINLDFADGMLEAIMQKFKKINEMGNSVPSTDQSNMQLVTDANGEKVWEEKPFFKNVSIDELAHTLEDIAWQSDDYGTSMAQANIPADFFVVGNSYAFEYNGKIQVSEAYLLKGYVVMGEIDMSIGEYSGLVIMVAGDTTMLMLSNETPPSKINIHNATVTYKQLDANYVPLVTADKPGALKIIDLSDGATLDEAIKAEVACEEEYARIYVNHRELCEFSVVSSGSPHVFYRRAETPTRRFEAKLHSDGKFYFSATGEVNSIPETYVRLASPNGTIYRLSVSDDGEVRTIKVS